MSLRKFIGILLFTAVETVGVGLVWDTLFDHHHVLAASLVAFPFFTLEHIIAKNVSQGLPFFTTSRVHLFRQIILGLSEVAFWDVWRLLHERVYFPVVGPVIAVIVFAALLVPQHNAEGNTNKERAFFASILRTEGVLISIIESMTAFGWLLYDDRVSVSIGDTNGRLIALVPLFIGLLVEHFVRVFGEAKGQNV